MDKNIVLNGNVAQKKEEFLKYFRIKNMNNHLEHEHKQCCNVKENIWQSYCIYDDVFLSSICFYFAKTNPTQS